MNTNTNSNTNTKDVARRPNLYLSVTVSAVSDHNKKTFLLIFFIADSPTKGVRIRDGETDLEDFDLGLESELEDVKN